MTLAEIFASALKSYWFDNAPIYTCDRTGSRYTCDPAPMDTDEDWIVYVESFSKFQGWAINAGFEKTTPEDHEAYGSGEVEFKTYRRGEMNLIVTEDRQFYDDWMLATCVCRELNLLEKADRIRVFQGILYGNWSP